MQSVCRYLLHYIYFILLGWKAADQQGRPKSILFVEELTGLISENLPDLWKLGQTYLNKTLFQVGLNCCLVNNCYSPLSSTIVP